MDKLVDLSSVSIFGSATFDDHVEQMDTSTHSSTTPDPSEALKKFNELFTSGFTRLESLLAKVSSHESQTPWLFTHSRILVQPHRFNSGCTKPSHSSTDSCVQFSQSG